MGGRGVKSPTVLAGVDQCMYGTLEESSRGVLRGACTRTSYGRAQKGKNRAGKLHPIATDKSTIHKHSDQNRRTKKGSTRYL